jgi:ribosomal protein S18 acetylase RimI-like enzyme
VIGVDPASTGRGSAAASCCRPRPPVPTVGLTVAMLYTEADNVAARRLYRPLGFRPTTTVTVFERAVEPQTPTPTAEPIP